MFEEEHPTKKVAVIDTQTGSIGQGLLIVKAAQLAEEGKSLNEIARIMGYNNDSSIRSLLNTNAEQRMLSAEKTAEVLKKELEEEKNKSIWKKIIG